MTGDRNYSVMSPADWGLTPALHSEDAGKALGIPQAEIEARCRSTLFEWLPHHWNGTAGAFGGHYDPRSRKFEPPQLVNLIAPWLLIAGYDRYEDSTLLDRAVETADWLHDSGHVVTHPMSIAMGGVLETGSPEAWTKYTAEYVLLNIGLAERLPGEERFMERALQSGRFLVQAVRHRCAVKYVVRGRLRETWDHHGWQAFGRMIEALLSLYTATGDADWRRRAVETGEAALSLQGTDGCFRLINGEYYNSDLAADPIRGLVCLTEETGDGRFVGAARRFADWHLQMQSANGSWPLTVDDEDIVVSPTVGPGDIPNIGISLLRLHEATGYAPYLESAIRAFHYSLDVQITPESGYPYRDDPAVLWGFWSWMPFYDYTVSADQATHHVRGLFFIMDYLASLRDARPLRDERA